MNMDSENYVENVLRTDCPITPELIERLTQPETIRLLHASMGLVTEAGELADMLKKHIFYGRKLDKVNAKEETGDALWYVGLAVDVLKSTMNEIMTMNIEKLRLRYPEKFSEADAIERNVEAERELLEQPFEVVTLVKENGTVYELRPRSLRGADWCKYACEVLMHVETYTVPQYGDKGEDQVTEYTSRDCMTQVRRYGARFGTNARPGQDLLDLLKTGHYVQLTHMKLEEEKTQETIEAFTGA